MAANEERTFWQKLAANPALWHEEAFEKFPSVIAHEYKRLRQEFEQNSPFSAMLQIKDVMETLLKFEVLLAYAWAEDAKIPEFRENVGCTITTPSLSLGAWRALGCDILDFFDEHEQEMPQVLSEPLQTIAALYDEYQIVTWRNNTVGHGALAFSEDEEFRKDIQEKLRQIVHIFEMVEDELSQHMLYAGDENLLLMGSENARNLAISDQQNPAVTFRNEGLNFMVSPYMVIRDGGVYFFDNQKKPKKTQRLCYSTGKKREDNEEYFTMLDAMRSEQGLRLEFAPDISISDAEDDYLNRLGLEDSFVRPEHLIQWLEAQMNAHSKGVYLLKMPRGTGKSTFAEQLNCLYKNPKITYKKTDARCYHIFRTQVRSGFDFEKGIEWQWERAYDNRLTSFWNISQYRAQGKSSAQAFADFLNQVMVDRSKIKRSHKRILMVIDGLDEAAENAIWEYIPSAELLADGVHILLTSRDPESEADLPQSLADNLNKLQLQDSLTVRRDSEENRAFLRTYADRVKKIDENQREKLIELAQQRVLYLSMYCDLLSRGMKFKELPQTAALCKKYLSQIEKQYGEKKKLMLHRVLSVLSGVGRFEPLSLKEIAELAGESGVTFNLLGVLNDLRAVMKVSRGYASGETQYGGENRYSIANEDMAQSLFGLLNNAKSLTEKNVLDVFEELAQVKEGEILHFTDGMMISLAYADELLTLAGTADYPQLTDAMCQKMERAIYKRREAYILVLERLKKCGLQAMKLCEATEQGEGFAALCDMEARICSELTQMDHAVSCYNQARKTLEALNEAGRLKDREDLAYVYHQLADIFSRQGSAEDALYWYHQQRMLQEVLDAEGCLANRSRLVMTYHFIACIFEKQGSSEEALFWFHKARSIEESLDALGQLADRTDLAARYKRIAKLLDTQDKVEDAFFWLQKALNICESLDEREYPPDRNIISGIYRHIAAIFYRRGQAADHQYWDEKADLREQVELTAKIASLIAEINSDKFANDRNALAEKCRLTAFFLYQQSIWDEQNKVDEALYWYERARKIKEELDASGRLLDRNTLARTYERMSFIYQRKDLWDDALSCLEKSVSIQEELDAAGRLVSRDDLADAYGRMARFFAAQKQWKEALFWYQKVMELLEEIYAAGCLPSPHDLTGVYDRIADILAKQNRAEEAWHFYQKVVQIEEELDAQGRLMNRSSLVMTYKRMGRFFSSQEQYEQALFWYKKALKRFGELDMEGNPYDRCDLAEIYERIAEVLAKQNRPEEALEFYQQAMQIEEELDVQGQLMYPRHLARTYKGLARLLDKQGKPEDAHQYWLKAEAIRAQLDAQS